MTSSEEMTDYDTMVLWYIMLDIHYIFGFVVNGFIEGMIEAYQEISRQDGLPGFFWARQE